VKKEKRKKEDINYSGKTMAGGHKNGPLKQKWSVRICMFQLTAGQEFPTGTKKTNAQHNHVSA